MGVTLKERIGLSLKHSSGLEELNQSTNGRGSLRRDPDDLNSGTCGMSNRFEEPAVNGEKNTKQSKNIDK